MSGTDRPDRPGSVVVRTATTADTDALVALLVDGTLGGAEDPEDRAAYRDALAEIEATVGSDVLVAEIDATVVGMCQLTLIRHVQERGGRCAEIESMHVAADRRGGGIGRMLLDAAVDRARAAGCYRVQLTSNSVRTDAHRFYVRAGFAASHVGFKRYLR